MKSLWINITIDNLNVDSEEEEFAANFLVGWLHSAVMACLLGRQKALFQFAGHESDIRIWIHSSKKDLATEKATTRPEGFRS